MHKLLISSAIAAVISSAAFAPACAAARCPEMRTISGECVNPAITRGLRRQAIDFTQQKFSYTAPPRLPGTDYGVLVPRDWNEIFYLFSYPAIGPIPPTSRRP